MQADSDTGRWVHLAPVISAILALVTWGISSFYEQSAKDLASVLADARRDGFALRTSMLLSSRLTDIRLLLGATHNADCSEALKSVPIADERTRVEQLREQDSTCLDQLKLFKSACGSDTRNLETRVDAGVHFGLALDQYEALARATPSTNQNPLVTARESFKKAYKEHIAPIGPITPHEISTARRNCNDLNPLMRRQRDFLAAWEPLAQRFYLELDSLPARYDNVMNSLTTASAEANRRSQAIHLLALGLSGLAALLVLVEKWLGLRKRNVTTPPGP